MELEIDERVVSLPWGEVSLKCWNSRSLPPTLAVHGASSNAGTFDRLIPLLPKDRYYVCVDLPGHGRSAHFTKGVPINFIYYVWTLRKITQIFGWTTYSLMAHSFGVQIVLILAAVERTKVETLILIEMAIPAPIQEDQFQHYLQSYFCLQDVLDKKSANQKTTSMSFREALDELMSVAGLSEESAKCVLERELIHKNAGVEFTSDPRKLFYVKTFLTEATFLNICSWTAAERPVLYILAKDSQLWEVHQFLDFYKKIRNKLTKSNPKSKYIAVEGKHSVHSDNPIVIAPIIRSFLQDTRKLLLQESKI